MAHYYQPGFTLIGSGIKPAQYVVSTTEEYVPSSVEWVQETVAEIDPESNKVVTDMGRTFPYDFLIVATGLSLHYEEIEGMERDLIGKSGIASIYNGPEAAYASWQAFSTFIDSGGRGIFTRPSTEMKCAGAPLKYTFLAEDHSERRKRRNDIQVEYFSNNNVLFSVPIVSEKVRMLFQARNIPVHYERVLSAIEPGRQIATFRTRDGTEEQPYDFIHVIPPMRAPEAVRNSPLPWQTGKWAAEGWMEVDRHTLRHARYHNVFGVGERSEESYEGYTSCPLITRLGRAMLIEFDYDNNLVYSFPGFIAPLEELWVSWVMKTMALKPTYISMLRGRA